MSHSLSSTVTLLAWEKPVAQNTLLLILRRNADTIQRMVFIHPALRIKHESLQQDTDTLSQRCDYLFI